MNSPRQGRPRQVVERLASVNAPLLAVAIAAAPVVTASLQRDGLERTLQRLDRVRVRSGLLAVDSPSAERAARWAFRVLPFLRGQCLHRSLVQYALHRLGGTKVRFVIGVRRGDGGINAHAWIEDGHTEDGLTRPAGAEMFFPLLARETP